MLKNLKTGLAIFAFFIAACSDEVKIPKEILPKAKMVELMADMHIAEAAVNTRNYMLGNNEYIYYVGDAYALIYKSHKITKKQFDKSFTYYSQHPVLLSSIYKDVISELSKKQAEAVNSK